MKPIFAFTAVLALALPVFAQQTGWIGVSIAEQPDRGVLVRSVEANSPAEKAGIKANDVIVQFNREEVTGVLQMQRLVNETPVGRTVDVVVRRDNRDQTLKVTSETAAFPNFPGRFPVHVGSTDSNSDFVLRNLNTKTHVEVLTSASVSQSGLRADALTSQLRDFFGVKPAEGVLISSVEADSAAAKAGVMAGDVVIAIEGRVISTPQDFSRELRSRAAPFTLKIVRNKLEREMRVER